MGTGHHGAGRRKRWEATAADLAQLHVAALVVAAVGSAYGRPKQVAAQGEMYLNTFVRVLEIASEHVRERRRRPTGRCEQEGRRRRETRERRGKGKGSVCAASEKKIF